jgi:putative DNA primase/helicase
MARNLAEVQRQIEERGLELPLSVDLGRAFDKIIRWRPPGDKRKSAWARLFEHQGQSGKVYVTGVFGVRSDKWNVEASNEEWSPAERAEWIEARKKAEREAQAARKEEAETAAEKAARFWAKARTEGAHAYLERKKVGGYGVRYSFNDRLLVPLCNLAAELKGLQWISPEGEKIFGTGTAKDGHFHLVGEILAGQPIAFGEGYATCASGHMATGWPVVTCFDAGNLEPVMKVWRAAYPQAEFVVLADDDRHLLRRFCERLNRVGVALAPEAVQFPIDERWELPDGQLVTVTAAWAKDGAGVWFIEGRLEAFAAPDEAGVVKRRRLDELRLENAGRAKAMAAAKKHKAHVLLPRFEKGAEGTQGATDWNDLHCASGLAAVREQLMRGLEEARGAQPASGGRSGGRSTPPGGAAAQGDGTGAVGDVLKRLTDRYVLIYGTTTVWDNDARMVVKLEALRAAHRDWLDHWLDAPERRMVREDQVVFDPGLVHDQAQVVNLFERLPLEPGDPAGCQKIVDHLFHLCHGDPKLFHWVACWLAYPLQHPGAKMRTALVLHGLREGTGKSLMMDVMRAIYGRYARTVTQLQLQTEFTDWLSGMLFCVAEEVVTAAERKHHKGLLKNLITNETVQINPKNMPLRQEENHANFSFLSNEQQPMQLDPFDRRFTVINVEEEKPKAWFAEIGAERASGGDAAFYAWLLQYDLGDFNEFTRPYENRDRERLVTLGMNVDRRFWHFWHKGLTDLPYCSCRAVDLYLAFKTWCRINGERFVPNSTAFGTTMGREVPKYKTRLNVFTDKAMVSENYAAGAAETMDWQGMVYLVPYEAEQPEADQAKRDRLRDDVRRFQGAVGHLLSQARHGV